MNASVVIPTYNRSRLLRDTVPALVNQRVGPLAYEVIFVSNGSTDGSDDLLAAAARTSGERIRFIRIEPTGGPSAPRNVGIRAAQGDVLIILDDDVLPDENLVAEHVAFHARHSEPHIAAIGEAYVPAHLLSDPMTRFHAFDYERFRGRDRLSYLDFWTCNVSMKRRFMLEAGMFDESFLFFEDVDCGRRLDEAGMHLKFLPSARGQHLHQLKPSGVPAKGEFTGRWLYAFLQRHRDTEMMNRFGVLSRSLETGMMARRIVNRAAFRLIDNRATMAALRLLGAENGLRSRVSDLYYHIIFRRNIRAGYAAAAHEAKTAEADRASVAWVDRGESEAESTVPAPRVSQGACES